MESYYTAKNTSGNQAESVYEQQESIFVGERKEFEMRDCYNCGDKGGTANSHISLQCPYPSKSAPFGGLGVAMIVNVAKVDETPMEGVAMETTNKERSQK
eukprot:15282119-Ditylum_brightwellii.AAC.1